MKIQNIYIHTDGVNFHALANKVSDFHTDIIERHLARSGLTTEQQLTTIDSIIADLRRREVDGIIK